MTYLNLLPMSFRRRQIIVRRVKQWAAVWCVLLVAGAAAGWWRHADYRKTADKLETLERMYAPVRQLTADLRTMKAELAGIQQREALVMQLSTQRPSLTLVGMVARAVEQCDGRVSVRSMTLGKPATGAAPGIHGSAATTFTLEGLGVDNVSIARLAASLRTCGLFRQVNLESTQEEIVAATAARRYRLVCAF